MQILSYDNGTGSAMFWNMAGTNEGRRQKPEDEVVPAGQDDSHSSSNWIEENVALQSKIVKDYHSDGTPSLFPTSTARYYLRLLTTVRKMLNQIKKVMILKILIRDFFKFSKTLCEIARAAHCLHIQSLLDLTTDKIACDISCISDERVR